MSSECGFVYPLSDLKYDFHHHPSLKDMVPGVTNLSFYESNSLVWLVKHWAVNGAVIKKLQSHKPGPSFSIYPRPKSGTCLHCHRHMLEC